MITAKYIILSLQCMYVVQIMTADTHIAANRPKNPRTVPDLDVLSWIPNLPGLSQIFKDLQTGLGSQAS